MTLIPEHAEPQNLSPTQELHPKDGSLNLSEKELSVSKGDQKLPTGSPEDRTHAAMQRTQGSESLCTPELTQTITTAPQVADKVCSATDEVFPSKKSQQELIELALHDAKENPDAVLLDIIKNKGNYPFDTNTSEGRNCIKAILTQVLEHGNSPYFTARELRFGVGFETKSHEGQKALVEVLRLLANHYPKAVCEIIGQLGVAQESERLTLAKMCCKEHTCTTVIDYIREFRLTNEADILSLIKIAVREKPLEVIPKLANLTLPALKGEASQKVLVELLCDAVCHNPPEPDMLSNPQYSISKLPFSGLKNPEHIVRVILESYRHDPKSIAGLPLAYNQFHREFFGHPQVYPTLRFLQSIQNSPKTYDELVQLHSQIEQFTQGYANQTLQTMLDALLKSAQEEAKKGDSASFFLQHTGLKWIAFTMASLMNAQEDPATAEWLQNSHLLNALSSLHAPKMRDLLTTFMMEKFVNNPQNMSDYQTLQSGNSGNVNHTILPNLFISLWPECSPEEKAELSKLVKELQGTNQPLFRDAKALKLLLGTLQLLFTAEGLSPQDKSILLKAIFTPEATSKEVLDCLTNVSSIIELGATEKLQQAHILALQAQDSTLSSINSILSRLVKERFCDLLPLQHIPNLEANLLALRDNFRNFSTLTTLAGKINQLSAEERTPVKAEFVQYLEHMLDGTFKTWRYDETASIHLETLFKIDSSLKEKWSHNLTQELMIDAPEESQESTHIDIQASVKEQFQSIEANKERFAFLWKYVQTEDPAARKTLTNEITEHLKQEAENMKKIKASIVANKGKGAELDALNAQLQTLAVNRERLLFQKFAMGFFADNKGPVNLENVKQMNAYYKDKDSLKTHLESIYKELSEPKKQQTKLPWTVVETDDPCDMMNCVNEVPGSCLAATGNPEKNKCWVAYPNDGKIKVIALKDPTGKIHARAMIRLLTNEKKDAAGIYVEVLYPYQINWQSTAIVNMAKMKAESCSLPLFLDDINVAEAEKIPQLAQPTMLQSLGGRAPFEYVDAVKRTQDAVVEGSAYALQAKFSYLPKESKKS